MESVLRGVCKDRVDATRGMSELSRGLHRARAVAAALMLVGAFTPSAAYALGDTKAPEVSQLRLEACKVDGVAEMLRCGTFNVPEDRSKPGGRMLPLKVVVVPARKPRADAKPVFVLAGGPGVRATNGARGVVGSWENAENDVVLVDMRGTGPGHRLNCRLAGSDDHLQGYFEQVYQARVFEGCRKQLEKTADLTKYTTAEAVRDLDAVRRALGYTQINLLAYSYGTRFAQQYMRTHEPQVRSALLMNLSPPSKLTPLHHARSAQNAFDQVMASCKAQPACRTAFPDPHGDLKAVMDRLRHRRADVVVKHPVTGKVAAIKLSDQGFAEGMRVMMYSRERSSRLPRLLREARAGKLEPFAQAALDTNYAILNSIQFGLLMSVMCTEDVARIDPARIPAETTGTFMGDERVRRQIEACSIWPKGRVPAAYAEPVKSSIPTVLVSGSLDPVTPTAWGDEVARTLKNHLHVIMPDGHGSEGECIAAIGRQLFTVGLDGISAHCAEEAPPPDFEISEPS